MRRVKKFLKIAALAVLAYTTLIVVWLFYYIVWDDGVEIFSPDLQVSRCPAESAGKLHNYFSRLDEIIVEARVLGQSTGPLEKMSHEYQDLAGKLDSLTYPDCAEPLHKAVHEMLRLSAKAYAALARGGVISRIEARFLAVKIEKYTTILYPIYTRIYTPNVKPDLEWIIPIPEEMIDNT